MSQRFLLVFLINALTGVALAERAAVSVTDFEGRTVSLAAPAKRIVALAPHVVENLYSAGAGDRIVGVVDHSNYPPEALAHPSVGNYKSWNLELIAELRPDLIVMWASGSGLNQLEPLRQLNIPIYISEPRSLSDIPKTIRALGVLAGSADASRKASEEYEQTLAALRIRYARKDPLSVFYQVWNDPLQTLNGAHLISSIIKLCGGQNIFSDLPQLAPRVGVEAVLARNPDVVVASGMGEARPEWLDEWRRFAELKAVRREALLFVNPDLIQRPTVRVLQGAQSLCKQMDTLER
ncbi:MAG: cobalamin-binding protein [Pseudomonadota bacterium]